MTSSTLYSQSSTQPAPHNDLPAQPEKKITSYVELSIPKKPRKAKGAFRTISEVAKKLNVQQHVLRFWETKFSQVKPLKRGGGRRYYRPEDVALLERIHHLLYTEGYTIKGVQKLLREQGKANIIAQSEIMQGEGTHANDPASKAQTQPHVDSTPKTEHVVRWDEPQAAITQPKINARQRAMLEILLAELKAMRSLIEV